MQTQAVPDATLQPLLARLEADFLLSRVTLPDGSTVAVRSCGRASALPTVVLLHGISSGAASWLQTALYIGEQTRVIAWDAPGYGESTALPADAPTDLDYGRRLRDLLQAMGVQRCVLVGHSMGALMTLGYVHAWGHEQHVHRVVLISPARGYGATDQAATRAKVQADRLEALERLGVPGLAANIASRLLSPQADAAARAWVSWNTARLHPAGYRQAVALLCQSDLSQRVSGAVAIEVHCGDADVVTPPAACRDRAQAHRLPFALIPHAGHASPIEQTQTVAQLILRAAQTPAGDPAHE